MVTKLKLALQTPYLPLLLNTLFFGGVLFWFFSRNQGFFSIVLFVCFVWYLYAQSLFTHAPLWHFFFVFLALIIATPFAAPVYMFMLYPLFLVSWIILVGLERFVLIDRRFWGYTLSTILFLILISLYLLSGYRMGASGFFDAGLFIIGATLLFYVVRAIALVSSPSSLLFSLVGALLLFELLWALLLLPLRWSGVSILCLLFVASYSDYTTAWRASTFYYPSWLWHLLLFIIFFFLISLTTAWRL